MKLNPEVTAALDTSTTLSPTEPQVTRRDFLKLAVGAAVGVALGGIPNTSTIALASSERAEPFKYRLFSGGDELTVLTPDHPLFGEDYRNYVTNLKEKRQHAGALYNLVDDVVKYTFDTYYQKSLERSRHVPQGVGTEEVFARLDAGIGVCDDIALLNQFGLHSLGIHSQLYAVDFVATADGKNYYVAHANLEVRMTKPGETPKFYVLEGTNGTVMERDKYYQFLKSYFNVLENIVNRRPITTGLE
jgi:hypothetical protein